MKKHRLYLILLLILADCLSPVYGCKRILEDQKTENIAKKLKPNLISEKIKQIKANILIQRNECIEDLDLTKEKTRQVDTIKLSLDIWISILNYLPRDSLLKSGALSKGIYLAPRNIWKDRMLNLSNWFLMAPSSFKNITTLLLSDCQIDDTDVQSLSLLSNLMSLDVSGDANSINDTGIQALSGIKNLKHLNLSAAIISEDSIRYLFPLLNLTHLNLSLNNITDFSVQYLSSLTCLESLNLNDNKITNVGLQYLFHLENLTNLYLDGNQVTDTDDESESSNSSSVS